MPGPEGMRLTGAHYIPNSYAIWGHHWSHSLVQFLIANMSVVQVLTKGSSKEPSGLVMHLLQCLSFFSAYYQFSYEPIHIPGALADDISRN